MSDMVRMDNDAFAQDPRIVTGVQFIESSNKYLGYMARNTGDMIVLRKRGLGNGKDYDYGALTSMILWSPRQEEVGRILASGPYFKVIENHNFLWPDGEGHYRFIDQCDEFPKHYFGIYNERSMGNTLFHKYFNLPPDQNKPFTWKEIIEYSKAVPTSPDGWVQKVEEEMAQRNICDAPNLDPYEVFYLKLMEEMHQKLHIINMIP